MLNGNQLVPNVSKVMAKINGIMTVCTFNEDYRGGQAAITDPTGHKWLRTYSKIELYVEPAIGELSVMAPGATGQPTLPSIQLLEPSKPVTESEPVAVYDVNQRFGFMETLVDMVVGGDAKGLLVTGSGGLGKSHTVFSRLGHHDLGTADYEKISGHMTPLALYSTLHRNSDKITVFDDCDSVLLNVTTANLLKAALDSFGRRTVHWESSRLPSELPSNFEFNGRVIFISNFTISQVPQPLVSRSMYVDVTMTAEEKITRIRTIAAKLCPDLATNEVEECVDLLDRLKYRISDLNFRTMQKVGAIRKSQPRGWYDLASYMVTALSTGKR